MRPSGYSLSVKLHELRLEQFKGQVSAINDECWNLK